MMRLVLAAVGLTCAAAQLIAANTGAPSPSPAELAIETARREIAQKPGYYPYYNKLAMAYARRARETSDVRFYGEAEKALEKSFEIQPDNFDGLKVRAWLLLGRHEFAKALEIARRLNQQNPDDIAVYGYLVDANAELGNYPQAMEAAQWMLDLRPGNIAGLTRAAYLRELHGDLPGAIELMLAAYDSAGPHETEDRAWMLTQASHLYLLSGEARKAATYAQAALEVFPEYHYALGALAQVRAAQRRYREAASLYERLYRAAPHAENLFALASALEHAGDRERAAERFAEFERAATAESELADNANRELMAYYADVRKDPAKALLVAERERSRRHDAYTRDAYAWALASNRRYAEADAEIRPVIALGVKDPRILYHAGVIALRRGRTADAGVLLKDAASRYSHEAEALLERETGARAK
jgi:tetratricopeptide (TPR) repeat protein